MQKLLLMVFLAIGLAQSGIVHAKSFTIQRSGVLVNFDYSIAGKSARGTIPIVDADINFDINDPSSMRIDAVLAAKDASAGIAPLTAAMRGPDLLDTNRFSQIRYRSTGARGTAENLEILGEVTIRNITRPLTLRTTISPIDEDDGPKKFSVRMRGAIDRNAFGASGYPKVLGDIINLSILARIDTGNS